MKFTKSFLDLTKDDADIAGGKGASLGEMFGAGIPVPSGFVVLAQAFERFCEETDLDVEIDAILHTVNHKEIHTVDGASEKIKALILEEEIPADIEKEIMSEFSALGGPASGWKNGVKYVAVRSSATAEDSSAAAWAGQLDSFLNTTEKDVLEKVKHCWASLFTPRAIFYRFELFDKSQNADKRGLGTRMHADMDKISVAVVIQKMVESEVSGIAFSVHPVTEDYNQLIIEAGLGLGEAIVSGQITPDSYVVEKSPRRIIDKNVSEQEKGLFRASESPFSKGSGRRPRDFKSSALSGTSFKKGGIEKSGNEWIDIPKEKGASQKLSDSQILELSELILKIEKHYGFPCDIEWAFACPEPSRREKGKFYIVQSRPITTLKI